MSKKGLNCLIGQLDNSNEFEIVRSWYPRKSANYLADAVEAWRNAVEAEDDMYPSSKEEFDKFLNTYKDRMLPTKSTKTRQQALEEYTSLHSSFKQSELNDAAEYAAFDFSAKISKYIEKHPGITRADAIKALGGPMGIISIMKGNYAKYNSALFQKLGMSKEKADRQAFEFSRLSDNFNSVMQRAVPYIKLYEDIDINLDSLRDNLEKLDELDKDEARGDKHSNERYSLDTKTIFPHQTLAVETKKILSKIAMMNEDSGQVVRNSFGRPKMYNPIQISGVLHRIGSMSTIDDFMDNLRDSVDDYPWMQSLVDVLEKDSGHNRTTFMVDMLMDTTYYIGIWEKTFKNGSKALNPSFKNTRASKNALVRETANFMVEGLIGNYENSIFNENGTISRPFSYSEGADEDSKFFKSKSEYLAELKKSYQVSALNKQSEGEMKGKSKTERVKMWRDANVDTVSEVHKLLRGAGFNISRRTLDKVFDTTHYASEQRRKRRGSGYAEDQFKAIVSNLQIIYRAAASSIGSNSEDFYKNAGNDLNSADVESAYEKIGKALASSVLNEAEDRARVGDKSYSTYTKPNILNQVFKQLIVKAGNLNEEEFHDWLMQEFGFEGMLDASGNFTGWLADAYESYGDAFEIVDLAEFINDREYEALDVADKWIASYVLQTKESALGHYLFEVPIESDYSVNNYVRHKKLEVGSKPFIRFDSNGKPEWYDLENEAVNALTDEVLCEIERIRKAIDRRAANEEAEANGQPLPYPDLGVYDNNATKFSIFPAFNRLGVYDAYLEDMESNPSDALRRLKQRVAEQMWDIVVKNINKANSIGVFSKDYFSGYFVNEKLRNELLEILPTDDAKTIVEKEKKKAEFAETDVKVSDDLPKMPGDKFAEFMSYSINSFYGRQQISKIMGFTREWFESTNEMEKRQMWYHAPGTPIDYTAEWNGQRVGREYQTCLYLDDSIEKSAMYDDIVSMFQALKDRKLITNDQFESFKHDYANIKETDGQAFRTMKSFREMRIMIGDGAWTQEYEDAYWRIMNDSFDSEEQVRHDLSLFLNQNLKPVTTGYEIVEMSDGSRIRVPVLHKCSEAVLLPASFYSRYGIEQAGSTYLKALAESADKHGIDAFEYRSDVKVGYHSYVSSLTEKVTEKVNGKKKEVLDPDTGKPMYVHKSAQDMIDHIDRSIKASDYALHRIHNKYYRITASTPVHIVDTVRSWSSQALKTLLTDFERDETIVLPGYTAKDGSNRMKAKDARRFLESMQTAIIANAYNDLVEMMKDPDRIEELLQEELGTKDYYSPEVKEMLTMLNDGSFLIAPFNPTVERIGQQLMLSIIRKRLTRPTTKGGSVIVQTAVGMDMNQITFDDDLNNDEKLHIVFEGEGANRHVKWIECYLPIYDSRFKKYADRFGNISRSKLEQMKEDGVITDNLLNFVAYRTPSDGPHSTIPFHVVGFKSNITGGGMMTTRDADVMLGQDKDGDKMLAHFKDFEEVVEFNDEALHNEYVKFLSRNPVENVSFEAFSAKIKKVYGNMNDEDVFNYFVVSEAKWLGIDENDEFSAEEARKTYDELDGLQKEMLKQRLETYQAMAEAARPKVTFKEYAVDWSMDNEGNMNTSFASQDKRALDNAMIDIVFAVQTSPQGSRRMLMPGGFEEVKRPAKTIILAKRIKESIRQESGNTQESANRIKDLYKMLITSADKFKRWISKSSGDISKKLDEFANDESCYTSSHAIDSYANIIKGKQVIDRLALYNSALDQLQDSRIWHNIKNSKKESQKLELFNHKVGELFAKLDRNGHYSSRILSQVINAAVDNGKDPILGEVNINEDTVDFFAAMTASGFTMEDILLFMNHPVFLEVTKRKQGGRFDYTLADAANAMSREINNMLGDNGRIPDFAGLNKVKAASEDDFVAALGESYGSFLSEDNVEFAVGMLAFIKYMDKASQDLNDLISIIRPESSSGSVGSTTGQHIEKIRKLRNFIDRYDNKELNITLPIEVANMLTEHDIEEGMDADAILDVFSDAFCQNVSALNTLSQRKSMNLIKRFFPQADRSWIETILNCYDLCYRNAKFHKDTLFDQMIGELMTFMLMKNPEFVANIEQDREKYLNDVPIKLIEIHERITKIRERVANGESITEDEQLLLDNRFLARLYTIRPQHMADIPRINFDAGGALTSDMAQDYRTSWGDLLKSGDPEIVDFAKGLYMYNLFADGFRFGQYSFSQFAPISLLLSIPGYYEAMNGLIGSKITKEDADNFILQYGCNHYFNNNVAPVIDGQKKVNPYVVRVEDNGDVIYLKKEFPDGKGFYRIKGKDGTGLYVCGETKDGWVMRKMPMLGAMSNKKNQFLFVYNPSSYATDMKPFRIDATKWPHLRDIEEADRLMSEMGEQEYYASQSQKLAQEAISKAIDEMFPGSSTESVLRINSKEVKEKDAKPNTFENFKEKAEKADAANNDAAFNAILDVMMPSLVKVAIDENGNEYVVEDSSSSSPGAIRQAREQRAFVELNRRLRDILAKAGVSVGFLDDIQSKIYRGGNIRFESAEVAANGLIELIKIANNENGEYALPEEFAHAALNMLGRNHPLVARLVNSLYNNHEALMDVFGDQYDQYARFYHDNMDGLAVEAAGWLVARQLIERQMVSSGSRVGNLVRRVVELIKSLLRKISGKDIQIAIKASKDMASDIAKGFLEGSLADELNIANVSESENFNTTTRMIDKNNGILDKLLKRQMHTLKLYERRMAYATNKNKGIVEHTKTTIASLKNGIRFNKVELTISKYLDQTMSALAEAEAGLMESIENGASENLVCSKLNAIRDMVYGYSMSLNDIQDFITKSGNEFEVNLKESLDKATALVNEFNSKYHDIAMKYFENFIRNFYGDSVKIPVGKHKGKIITVEDMARYAPADIGFMSRWLDSLSDSPDLLNKVFDEKVKEQKFAARTDTLNLEKRVQVAIKKLEEATGSRDTSFMYKYDANGKKIGRYLNEKEAEAELNDAQKEYYDFFIDEKKKLNKYLPSIITGSDYNTIKIRENTFKKARAKGRNAVQHIWDLVEESTMEMDDFNLDVDEVLVDFQGNRIDMLPVKYCRKAKGETEEDMLEDTATALILYAGMANNYARLNNVIGILENARYMSREREVQQRNGSRRQIETIKDDDFTFQNPLTKKQAETNLGNMLDDFFMMQIYGHMEHEEGTVGDTRFSKSKLAKLANRVTSWSNMAVNPLNRLSNIGEGVTQILTEMAGGEFFGVRDVVWANNEYRKCFGDFIMNIGNEFNDGKLYLWNKMLDITQENDDTVRENEYGKTGLDKWKSKISLDNVAYYGLKIGEHHLASTTSLAIAHKYILKDASGKNVNLYDAFEVAYTDPVNKTGAFLKLKEGVTKLDGSEFSYEDIRRFSEKCAGVNFRLQGIYNKNDKSPIQAHWYGQLIIMYRKWIRPSLVRRYGNTSYNNLTESWNEGYWLTTWRFIKQIASDFDHFSTAVKLNWQNLDEYERTNVRKAAAEIGILIGTMMAIALMKAKGDDDDDFERNSRIPLYLLYKIRNSVGTLAPTPESLNEGLKLLASPFAALNTIKKGIAFMNVMNPSNWTEESKIKSGRYKGKYRGEKIILEAPIISLWKNFDNLMDPSDLIQYYDNDLVF